jgi:molybdenum cofactor guanylyltransferase
MISPDLYGLILSGGFSTRMGTDKSLLVYHSKPQREYLFEIMQKFCEKVFISCREDQNVPAELNPLPDRYDFRSPMNGILSAFTQHPDKAWLVVAVDMPYVDEQVLQTLIQARHKQKIATCFFNEERKLPEPLLTIWEPIAFTPLRQQVEQGMISPQKFLLQAAIHLTSIPHSKALWNVNNPDERPGDLSGSR